MLKFIQLSDLHIRGSNKKEENVNCKLIVQYIIEHYPGDDKPIILLTGDIVDDGKQIQYKNAVTLLRPLIDHGFTIFATPGNHDYGPWGTFYTEAAQARFQEFILGELLDIADAKKPDVEMEDLYPMVDIVNDVLFIGLDSVVANEDQFLHFSSGEVGHQQLERTGEIIQQHPNQKKVVYFHHHPFYRMVGMQMDDADRMMRLLANQADFVCFGHKHVPEIWSADYDIDWILASGKTTERNARYKFQFREATINDDDNWVTTVTFMRE